MNKKSIYLIVVILSAILLVVYFMGINKKPDTEETNNDTIDEPETTVSNDRLDLISERFLSQKSKD